MTSNLARFVGAARAAALGLMLLLATGSVIVPTAAVAASTPKQEELSSKVRDKYKPAKEAFDKEDYATALTAGKDALAIAEKPYDKMQMLYFLRNVVVKQKDYASYAEIQEQLNALDIVPAAEKINSYKNLANIYAQAKNWEKATQYSIKWSENGGGYDADTLTWQLYLTQNDCEKGLTWLEKAAGEHETTEQELLRLNSCYFKLSMKDRRRSTMEQLVKRFMKHDYLYDLLLLYDEDNKMDPRAKLNYRRLEFLKGFMTRESEYTDYAEDALEVGSPTEAMTVLTQGKDQNVVKFIAATDRPSRMLAQSKQQAADDKRQVASLDKEAQAGKNGEADVKVGLVYLGQGEYQKAADAIKRGLSPDRVAKVKRVDDANMMLGIAEWKLGNTDQAKAAFTAAQADPRMANTAGVWIAAL